jgi:two-component system, OmpR family, alkaline phosphatase synthesis response regulator PhoP
MKNTTAPQQVVRPEEILIIEDDLGIVELLTQELTKHRYRVRDARDGQTGLAEAQRQPPDLVILDLMLPGPDGWEVCRLLKSHPRTKGIPLLILTALGQEEDRLRGLELGADDYITKPFSLKELMARIRALLRRTRMSTVDKTTVHLTLGPLSIDMERHEVRMAGRLLELTRTEFALLKHFAEHPGRVFTRDELITALWGEDRFVEEHNLDVHIHSLRQQLEPDSAHPRFLLTVRGVGYKLQITDKEQ